MEEIRYKDSVDAYKAIHTALGWAIDAMLEDCDYKKAIEYCELMRQIEVQVDD